MELDERSQLYANTKNIIALIEQIKCMQKEQQANIDKIYHLGVQIAQLTGEINNLKQIVFVMKALSMGNGPTVQ